MDLVDKFYCCISHTVNPKFATIKEGNLDNLIGCIKRWKSSNASCISLKSSYQTLAIHLRRCYNNLGNKEIPCSLCIITKYVPTTRKCNAMFIILIIFLKIRLEEHSQFRLFLMYAHGYMVPSHFLVGVSNESI